MAVAEDAAAVLDEFIHDVANLPAEIAHLFEEIQAKDRLLQDCRNTIGDRENQLQRFIRSNGGLVVHPKEEAFNQTIKSNYDRAQTLQEEKLALTDKAALLLDRQIRRLDIKIRDLTRQGVMPKDPALPSMLYPSASDGAFSGLSTPNTGMSTPLNPLSNNLPGTTIANSSISRLAHPQPQGRGGGGPQFTLGQGPRVSFGTQHLTSSAPATPAASAAAAHLHQRQRESSTGAINDAKRRRLNAHLGSLPSTSSALARPSSLGPGTPKAGTPSSVRSGSAGPKKTGGQANKAGATGAAAAASAQARRKAGRPGQQQQQQQQQAQAREGKSTKRPRKKLLGGAAADHDKAVKGASVGGMDGTSTPLAGGGGGSGSNQRASHKNQDVEMRDRPISSHGIKAEEDQDEHHQQHQHQQQQQRRIKAEGIQSRSGSGDEGSGSGAGAASAAAGGVRAAIGGEVEDEEDEEDEEDDEEDDDDDNEEGEEEGGEEEEEEEEETDKIYCTCRIETDGPMVGCDNPDCPYEWFHWACVGVTKVSAGAWYCPECRGASETEFGKAARPAAETGLAVVV